MWCFPTLFHVVVLITATSAVVHDNAMFDFIIVGAGSAGSVVASRLSEIPSVSVLLLEAGTEFHPVEYLLSEVPFTGILLARTAFDWQDVTVPQAGACQGMKEHRFKVPRGKAFGGTSRLNYMLYIRGNREDYDRWANLGNPGWSYDDVLPYFLKSEDNTNIEMANSKYHSTRGPLTVSDINYRSQLVGPFLQSAVETGLPLGDVNGESQMRVMPLQGTVRNGRRMHTGKAFLSPAMKRPNLQVVQGADVHKGGLKHQARASKEVIVSAGAIGSPKLLMLSGIGPEDQLKQFNITPIAILPGVGENYMSHYGTGLMFTAKYGTSIVLVRDIVNPVSILVLAIQWFFFGSGSLTTLCAMEATGFIKTTPELTGKPNWPDAQIAFGISTLAATGGFRVKDNFGFTDDVWNRYFQPLAQRDAFTLFAFILHPKSRGKVHLSSSDPNVPPQIDPNIFSHPDDMKAVISSLRQLLTLANSEAFKPYEVKYHDIVFPGCEQTEFLSDEYLECLVRGFTVDIWHYSGTCKMGPDSDGQAVVDAELRVRKVPRLRVVDSSIMPYITSGNTNAPTIMIGEMASNLIKVAHQLD